MTYNIRLYQSLGIFLIATLWVMIALGVISYFGWYSSFVPGLLIHTGIILVCVGCVIAIIKPLNIAHLLNILGFTKAKWWYYFIAIVIAVFFWVADFWLQTYFFLDDGKKDAVEIQSDIKLFGSISMVLAICFLAPIAEEVLFRGILLKGLVDKLSPLWSILLSSLLFAAIHFSLNDALTLFVVAVGYSILTLKAGSIWPAILAHGINNSVTLYYLSNL